MDKLNGINLQNIDSTTFRKGIYIEIDEVEEKISYYKLFLEELRQKISNLIQELKKWLYPGA